jgi:hypothetical protein
MFALALSGSVTATEQQPFDAVLYEQIHAEAIALATKVDRGEMSREDATLQLVQMQLTTMERNSTTVENARETSLAASMSGYQRQSTNCGTFGHILC